jgi:hypothetical protein
MRWIWLVLCFFIKAPYFSQNFTQTVKGRITENGLNTPLKGIKVQVESKNLKWDLLTDSLGYFRFEQIPVGRINLYVTHLNYEPITQSNLLLSSGKELDLNIELQEKTSRRTLSEVSVQKRSNTNDAAVNSVKNFSTEETQRFAASFNDPARMALSLAGVNATNDASNEIVVRGNSSRGILWRVEGIEIPNPNHFSNGEGGSGGGISILSGQVLSNSSFYSGAFPAEYGNALSGVFDIRFRKGNSDKEEFSVQLGILGLQSSLEGPFSKKKRSSFLFNYRYSTLIFLNAIGLPVVDNAMVPQFQDLSYHLHFPTKRFGNFTVFGMGGLSTAGDYADKDSSKWEQRSDRFEDESYQFIGVTGLTHTLPLGNEQGYIKTVLAWTKEEHRYRMDSLDASYQPQPSYREGLKYQALRSHVFYHRKLNGFTSLRVGGYYSQLFYQLKAEGLDLSTSALGTFIDDLGNTGLLQTYVQFKVRTNRGLEWVGGMHQSYLLLNSNQTYEPRMGLSYKLSNRHAVNASTGLHSRCEPVSWYLSQVQDANGTVSQPNKNLVLTRAAHAVLGHELSFNNKLKLKSEGYFQYLFKVPVDTSKNSEMSLLNASTGINQNRFINIGEGRNFGLEFTLDRSFVDGYFYMVTASLFQSEYRKPLEEWRSTRFNANIMLNAMLGYEWNFGKAAKNSLALNFRGIFRGGNRYTPIDESQSILQGKEVLVNAQPYASRLPVYFRTDVSATLRFNYSKSSLVFSTEIQNVTNQQNINRYYYDPILQKIRSVYMFGIMPVLNLKMEF